MLAQTVISNNDITFPNVSMIMCHSAVLYWLYTDEFKHNPTLSIFTSNSFSPPDPVVKSMLPLGSQITSSAMLQALTPGTVIVFVENGEAKHSCVALPDQQIGGNNQTGWYTSAGIGGRYSTHSMNDVKWRGKKVEGSNNGMSCKLIAIPENSAKAIVRSAIQG
jgi:hypothetical protein